MCIRDRFCGVDGSYKYYEDTGYRDISADSPLAPYVKWARDAGLMDGSNGSFLPDEKLTREQMATVVARYLTALGLASMDTAQTSYKDDARISAWAKSGVAPVSYTHLAAQFWGNRPAFARTDFAKSLLY